MRVQDIHKFIKAKHKHLNQNNQKNHFNQLWKFKSRKIHHLSQNIKTITFLQEYCINNNDD